MLKITISAIGRIRHTPCADLCEDYLRRADALGRTIGVGPFSVHESDAPRALTGAARKTAEAEMLRKSLPAGARRIALDEKGKQLTSRQFSELIREWRDDGAGGAAFVIGGADGLDRAIQAESDVSIAFGRSTWPHLLARAMLCEQLYRAVTILDGRPYHRE